MKIILALIALLLVSFSSGNVIKKSFESIDEFVKLNPNAKLIEMDAYDHELDGSRSYSLGKRQTGLTDIRKFRKLIKRNFHFR